jgi:hypothetical protein
MNPDNVYGLDANAHLLLDTRAIEVLAVPLLVKGPRLIDRKICAIDSDQTR